MNIFVQMAEGPDIKNYFRMAAALPFLIQIIRILYLRMAYPLPQPGEEHSTTDVEFLYLMPLILLVPSVFLWLTSIPILNNGSEDVRNSFFRSAMSWFLLPVLLILFAFSIFLGNPQSFSELLDGFAQIWFLLWPNLVCLLLSFILFRIRLAKWKKTIGGDEPKTN